MTGAHTLPAQVLVGHMLLAQVLVGHMLLAQALVGRYQVSQWLSCAAGSRRAWRKSVPLVYAIGNNPAWL